MVTDIQINDFDYELPEERIAVHPLTQRDECKLLVRSPKGTIYHKIFKELPDLLPPGALMVCNDTKVINARLFFQKSSGATIEVFLLEPVAPSDYALNFQQRNNCRWKCLVGNSKKWKEGEIHMEVPLDSEPVRLNAKRFAVYPEGASEIEFSWDNSGISFGNLIEAAGRLPIPPYLNRDTEESDLTDYQTVYAMVRGSVAAPTAGLHFTPNVFEGLDAHGVKVNKVTLHVGAGTFRPVKSDKIGEHPMHAEPFTVTRQLIKDLLEWEISKKPIVAVGTTSVRTLESLPYIGKHLMVGEENPFKVNQWEPYGNDDFDPVESLETLLRWMDSNKTESIFASTSIMIAPGFRWRITDCMVTNFHQPKSTLLLLVSSFLGPGQWRLLYEEALKKDYRFLSYGDASLLLR